MIMNRGFSHERYGHIHFPVSDVAKAIEGLHSNAKFLEEITESTRGAGMLHHRFVSGEGELMVIDEWKTAEQFPSFFDGNPRSRRSWPLSG